MTKRELLELVAEQAREILDCYKHQEELHAELTRETEAADLCRHELTIANDALRQIAEELDASDRTVNGLLYAILDIKENEAAARELSSAYAVNLKAIGEALGIADTSADGMICGIRRLKEPLDPSSITTSSEDWRPIRKMPEGVTVTVSTLHGNDWLDVRKGGERIATAYAPVLPALAAYYDRVEP